MVAVAVIGGAVIGAGAGIYGANKSASAQKDAAANAGNIQKQQYEQTRADLAPYRDFGGQSTNFLNDAYGFNGQSGYDRTMQNFRADPGYEYARTQAMNSVQGSAAARGGLLSGAAIRGVSDRTQGMADQGYNNWLSRYQNGQTLGANAAAQTGQFGAGAAQGRANSALEYGAAQGAGYAGMANGINGAINNGMQSYGYLQGMGAFGSPPPPASSVGQLPNTALTSWYR